MAAAPKLTVSFKSTQLGAGWAPLNVVAVWIEGPTVGVNPGPFVKTIGRWADVRKPALVAWRAKAEPGLTVDIDAVSGATRQDHFTTLTIDWDMKDKLGMLVPDGLYTIRMEMADGNSTAAGQNHQATFTFTKSLQPDIQMIPADPPAPALPKWVDVSINFNPVAGECNNAMVDTGETCDGNCPADCPVAENACAPIVLTGSAATCNAACVVQAVTTCINGDGCCAPGCGVNQDDDCASGELSQTGCATGSGNGTGALLAFALVGLVALFSRRRR
ncbi:MAG: DUF2271 domain-containing protein [Deltaproteobacteria bacterium]|nr:DUF2271 domain-containing protein [Deltaproteobacteria bacterium]